MGISGAGEGLISGGAFNQKYFFCLQVDRPVTKELINKRQFTVLYTFSRPMRTVIPHLVSSIVFFLHDFSEVSPKGVYLCVEPFNLQ